VQSKSLVKSLANSGEIPMNNNDQERIRALFSEAVSSRSSSSPKDSNISIAFSVTTINDTEREKIRLLFAQAEDDLAGVPTPLFSPIDSSTDRSINSSELQSQLAQVTSFVDSHGSGGSLKKNIEMQQASATRLAKVSGYIKSQTKTHSSLTERAHAVISFNTVYREIGHEANQSSMEKHRPDCKSKE